MAVVAVSTLVLVYIVAYTSAASMGPYTVEMESVGECEDWDGGLIEPDLYVLRQADKPPEMSGSFEVKEDLQNLTTKVTASEWGNGGYQHHAVEYDVKNWCGTKVSKEISTTTNVTLGANCLVPKGKYVLFDIDMDRLLHVAMGNILKYGRYRARIDIKDGKRRSVLCLNQDSKLNPAKSSHSSAVG